MDSPLKFIIFRLVLLVFGWQPRLAHFIKGQIRRTLILGQRRSNIKFERRITLRQEKIEIQSKWKFEKIGKIAIVDSGTNAPQGSQYFQNGKVNDENQQFINSEMRNLEVCRNEEI